jgi:hypothetical protein
MPEDDTHAASITIRFIDGSKLRLAGPRQAEDTLEAMRKLQLILDRPYLCCETEDGTVIIPMANVKYIQTFPKPAKLPEYFLKNTRIVES